MLIEYENRRHQNRWKTYLWPHFGRIRGQKGPPVCALKTRLQIGHIYNGYENLSTDMNYPIWRRQERGKYVVQLASSQLRTVLRSCQCACHTFFLANCLSLHHEIFKNNYHWKNDVHSKGQGQRSNVKITEVKATFAPASPFPDCNSNLNSQMAAKWCRNFTWHRRDVLLFFLGHP